VAANSLTPASCAAAPTTRLAADATSFTFDASGRQLSETTPAPAGQSGAQTTTYAYDAAGRLAQTTAPPVSNGGQNQVAVNTYNADGNLLATTTGSGTPAAATTSYCYDPAGDRTAVVAPDGSVSGIAPYETSAPYIVSPASYPAQAAYQTTYSYDSAGNPVSTTTPATSADPSGRPARQPTIRQGTC
jgi:YD repeat-containing protein